MIVSVGKIGQLQYIRNATCVGTLMLGLMKALQGSILLGSRRACLGVLWECGFTIDTAVYRRPMFGILQLLYRGRFSNMCSSCVA